MHKRYTTDRHHKKANTSQCTRDTQLIDIIKKANTSQCTRDTLTQLIDIIKNLMNFNAQEIHN